MTLYHGSTGLMPREMALAKFYSSKTAVAFADDGIMI